MKINATKCVSLVAFAFLPFACNDESENSQVKTKPFTVGANVGNFGLTSTAPSIEGVTGGWTGCNDPVWTINGSAGIVYASESCIAPTYSMIKLRVDGQVVELKLNDGSSKFVDGAGNVWTFSMSPSAAIPSLSANFNVEQGGGHVILTNRGVQMGVQIDSGDGPICDPANPFRVEIGEQNKISFILNPPPGESLRPGIQLSLGASSTPADYPQISIDPDRRAFAVSFYNIAPRRFEYKTVLEAVLGRSRCAISMFTVDLRDAQVTLEPLVSFEASPGTTPGNVTLNVKFPSKTVGYGKVEIRRVTGTTPPSELCNVESDTIVKTLTSFTDLTIEDTTGKAGAAFSYRACVLDASNRVAESKIASTASRSVCSYPGMDTDPLGWWTDTSSACSIRMITTSPKVGEPVEFEVSLARPGTQYGGLLLFGDCTDKSLTNNTVAGRFSHTYTYPGDYWAAITYSVYAGGGWVGRICKSGYLRVNVR